MDPSLTGSRPVCPWTGSFSFCFTPVLQTRHPKNTEGMHSQQRSVITTQSQQASSHLDCKRKSPPNKITDCHSGRRKCHKNDTHSDTNIKRNAVKHAHALCDNWHPHKWRTVCTTTVLSVRARCAVCLFASAYVCQQYLSHSFHSSDSFGRLCLRISRWSRRNVGVTTDGYSFFIFFFPILIPKTKTAAVEVEFQQRLFSYSYSFLSYMFSDRHLSAFHFTRALMCEDWSFRNRG